MSEIDVAPVDELPPGSVKIVTAGSLRLGVYNLAGKFCAIEDRCSHDDGPLCEGDWDQETCRVVCPRHGATFDLATGTPLTLPAYQPVAVYPVRVVAGVVHVDVD